MEGHDDLDKLASAVEALDRAVSRQGAVVRLERCGGPDRSKIVANRRGYLRLGIELLKAAVSHERSNDTREPSTIDVDLGYLIHPDSDAGFERFERREDLSLPPVYEQTLAAKAASIGCLIFCLLVVTAAVVGLLKLIF